MKITIDARMAFSSGIGTYLTHILNGLQQSNHDMHLLTEKTLKAPIYTIKEQLLFPWNIPPCDLLWSPHWNAPLLPTRAKKRIVTIHDLFFLDNAADFSMHKRLCAHTLIKCAITQATKIITVSHFSQERLYHYFPQAMHKTTCILSGANHLHAIQSAPICNLPSSFILFVGNLKPHKNIEVILKALAMFPSLHLVVAGKVAGFRHGSDVDVLMRLYPCWEKQVHLVGAVSNSHLKWLYETASCLVFPSLYEGWGLPPLEAMGLGCPVIASKVCAEGCGDAALLFEPKSAQELIEKLVELPQKREELIKKGKERASLFLWEQSAREHLTLFESLQ